jgi:hypothetical protein
MNTAIEADDAHPALRARARRAMDELHDFVRHTTRRGQKRGEIRAEVDPEMLSTMLLSVAEGALMQSKLYGNVRPMDRAGAYLKQYIEREVRA